MRKILVIGSGGSGKSTFAARLGARLKLEVIHLDSCYWQAGWQETPKAEWQAKVAEMIAREAWLMDGNYSGTLELRLRACDTVIFLDLPRTLCLWRVVKRALMYWGKVRPDMAAGCPEQLNFEFVQWIWQYPRRTRPKVLARLQACADAKQIIHLRSQAEVEKFLAGVTDEQQSAHAERVDQSHASQA
jgi:adenylate kinase family enzyme